MKTIAAIFISLFVLAACGDEQAKSDSKESERLADKKVAEPIDSSRFTTVQWIDSLKDFGSVKDGEKVDISFRFVNTGEFPLIVQSVAPSCGCTVPEYTEEPVLPGKEGFIKAVFNSANQHATVHKTINVAMNTKPSTLHTIAFMGNVVKQ